MMPRSIRSRGRGIAKRGRGAWPRPLLVETGLEDQPVDRDPEVRESYERSSVDVIVIVGDLHREVEILRRDIDVVLHVEPADVEASRHILDERQIMALLGDELDRVVRLQVADDAAV